MPVLVLIEDVWGVRRWQRAQLVREDDDGKVTVMVGNRVIVTDKDKIRRIRSIDSRRSTDT